MSAPDHGEEGLLVGAGAFKVDRAHALEKLRLYQLPPSVGGWLLWARCAAACGGHEAEVKAGMADFAMTFSGVPFSRSELEDPFAPLFTAAGPNRERGFTLALGLLQALASGPKQVVVETGLEAARLRMTARSLGDISVVPAPGPETRTRLAASWSFGSESRDRFLNRAYAGQSSVPLFHADRLTMKGDSVDRWPAEAAAGRPFRLGDALGRLAPPSFYTPPDSHLSLYKLGVYVCEQRELLPWAKVQAWVNDDKLTLSADQAGVVRNARFAGLMRSLARETEAMVLETARAHPGLMTEARRVMLGEAGQRVWGMRMQWGRQAAENLAAPALWRRLLIPGTVERFRPYALVLEAAERTLWLRDVAARLKTPGRTPPPGLAEAVTAALDGTERPV